MQYTVHAQTMYKQLLRQQARTQENYIYGGARIVNSDTCVRDKFRSTVQ